MLKFRHTLLMTVLFGLGIASVSAETIYVTNINDNGTGSLRQAIISANVDASLTTILIKIPGTSGTERIIDVPSTLPAFTAPVEIKTDISQTGKTVIKAPIINGPGAGTTGFTFNGASQNSKVELITFRNFVLSIVLNTGNITIINNNFENNIGGIDIRLVATGGNTIKANNFTTTSAGVTAIGGLGSGNSIQGNSFTGEGINIGSSGQTIGGMGNSDANTFTNISGDAIVLSNGSGSIVQHNTINGSSGVGINVSGIDMSIEYNNLSNIVGYDITIDGGHSNRINYNQVMGNNGVFNGIFLKNGVTYTVNNNWITGGSLELESMSASSMYGQMKITNNTIVNDPMGFSGHGAITLTDVTSANIIGNEIHHNGGNGIYLYNSSYNNLVSNTIYENGRTGINAGSALYNLISKNIIYNNHADAGGGRTGIFATVKTAPVITSAKRIGYNFVVSGTGTLANDSLEFFLSNQESRNSTLAQNALAYAATVKATGTSWIATIPVGNIPNSDIYFIATATDLNKTTSSFSKAVGVEINGPVQATTNHTSYYYAEFIPGATYSFWSTLPISSMTQTGNMATFNFNQVGSGTVTVGYTDPGTGAWKMYSLNVSVMGPARLSAIDETNITARVYPNPFTSSAKVKLDALFNSHTASLKLYNMKGELVYQSQGHEEGEEVEVGNDLKEGMYTLQIITDSEVKSLRIVKK